MRLRPSALLMALVAAAATVSAQGVASPTLELARLQDGAKSRRVSSYDVSGGNGDNVSKIPSGTRRDILPPDLGRFHAWYNHELTEATPEGENEWSMLGPQGKNTTGERNYLIADIVGKGHYVGVNYYVDNPSVMWYGEGDDMFFIDGESWPASLHGTGTEDYFNTSWSPNALYQHPYFGYGRVPSGTGWLGRTHVYRFHVSDPVYFDKSLRFSIEHGHNDNLTLDLSSVAYWYQAEPHKKFPPFPARASRKPMPPISEVDIHRWRHEWRKAKGPDGRLWGNEKE